MLTMFGVILSTAVVYVFFKGLLCVAFDLSQYFVNRLTDTKGPEISEFSASSAAKTLLFWVSVIFLGFIAWKLLEKFALERALLKAVAVAVGLGVLGMGVLFIRFLITKRASTDERDISGTD